MNTTSSTPFTNQIYFRRPVLGKKFPSLNYSSVPDVAADLRELAIHIGIYRLFSELTDEEDNTLCSLQTGVARIGDEFARTMGQGRRSSKRAGKVGELVVKLIDSLIEGRIRSISPELYDSVRDFGVKLLDLISPAKEAA